MKIHVMERNNEYWNQFNFLTIVSLKNNVFQLLQYNIVEDGVVDPRTLTAEQSLENLTETTNDYEVSHEGKLWRLSYPPISIPPSDLDGPMGEDEFADYSVLDLYYNVPQWKSRFVDTKNSKIQYSARLRAIYNNFMIATISVPFANDWNTSQVVVYNKQDRVISNLELGTVVLTDSNPQNYIGSAPNWHQYMWGVGANVQPRSDSNEITIDVQLFWNADGSPCAKSTALYVQSDAGYVVRSKVITDENGRAQIKIIPLGLSSGDKINVKFNSATYSKISVVEVVV